MNITKKIVGLALVGALGASMAVPAAAATRAPRHSCGGEWTAGAVCNFRYAGGSLHVGGGYQADPAGYVTVTLEAIDPETERRVPVLSCAVGGGSFGGCASVSTGSLTIDLRAGQRLFCTVQGADAGHYSCSSDRT
jgi:hypothetical protein